MHRTWPGPRLLSADDDQTMIQPSDVCSYDFARLDRLIGDHQGRPKTSSGRPKSRRDVLLRSSKHLPDLVSKNVGQKNQIRATHSLKMLPKVSFGSTHDEIELPDLGNIEKNQEKIWFRLDIRRYESPQTKMTKIYYGAVKDGNRLPGPERLTPSVHHLPQPPPPISEKKQAQEPIEKVLEDEKVSSEDTVPTYVPYYADGKEDDDTDTVSVLTPVPAVEEEREDDEEKAVTTEKVLDLPKTPEQCPTSDLDLLCLLPTEIITPPMGYNHELANRRLRQRRSSPRSSKKTPGGIQLVYECGDPSDNSKVPGKYGQLSFPGGIQLVNECGDLSGNGTVTGKYGQLGFPHMKTPPQQKKFLNSMNSSVSTLNLLDHVDHHFDDHHSRRKKEAAPMS